MSVQDDEVGEEAEVHRTTGGTGGGGRLNIGKEVVDAFLEGTAIGVWEGVDKGDVPGEFVPWDWHDSHSDSESPSSEGAALEPEVSSVKVGVLPKGL
jgi:hypothetical protein